MIIYPCYLMNMRICMTFDCYGLYGVFLELLFRHYQYVFLYIHQN